MNTPSSLNLIYGLRTLLAFTRIPGNAFSYTIRRLLNWSRGTPKLPSEDKERLFGYLHEGAAGAETRSLTLENRFQLSVLREHSTRSLYRKNLYLLEILENAWEGLPKFNLPEPTIKALDVGAQDWHYVFALERWLRFGASSEPAEVILKGVELDGYGIYPDLHSRRDYAQAYAAQTGNLQVTYEVDDFLRSRKDEYDLITHFYPFLTRRALLLWGLPLRFFNPADLVAKSAELTRKGGRMVVFNHTMEEHEIFLNLARASGAFHLLRTGNAQSDLVEFHLEVTGRRFSVWERI